MRLRPQSAERHRLRAEARENRSLGFHFFERDRLAGHEFEQIADGNWFARLREFGICAIAFRRRRLHVFVHAPHEFRRACVALAGLAEAVQAFVVERRRFAAVGARVAPKSVFEEAFKGLAAQRGGGVIEEIVHNRFIQPDGFEQMAVAIARDRRDAHAREHFAQPGFHGHAILCSAARLQCFGEFQRDVRATTLAPTATSMAM